MAHITTGSVGNNQTHRQQLRAAIAPPSPPANLAISIRARIAALNGVTLELPPREPMREPPCFSADPNTMRRSQ